MAPTGGDNPPTPSDAIAPSGWQVAASNSTLNTWFAGRSQPSWLTSGKSVRPTPRPKPSRTPSTQSTTGKPVAAPVPLSASPVPLSASDPAAAHPHNQSQAHRPFLQTRLAPLAADTVLPSPAPSDEPSPSLSNAQESPQTSSSQLPEHQTATLVTHARFVLDDRPNSSEGRSPQTSVPITGPRVPLGKRKESSTVVSAISRPHMVLNTPPTPTAPMYTSTGPSPEQTRAPPAKKRRLGDVTAEFLGSVRAIDRLHAHLERCGGMTNLEINIERPRFQLVKDACAEGDLFFIALHQVFCVWTAKQGAFHQMCAEGVHDPSLMDNAFGIMGSILKSNSKLRQQHLTWFATFPVDLRPAPQLCDDATYALALRQVLDFLTYVSHRWMVVNHKHQTDGYPLLMSELLGTFGLFSPILQGIVFRASRRTLGVIDGPFGTQMEELFRADQQAHQNDDGSFKIQPPSQEYQKYNDSLKGNYKILIAQHFAAQGQSTQQGNQTHAQQLHRFPMANQTARTAAAPGSNPNNPTPPRFGVPYHPHTQSPINSPLNVQSPTTTPNSAYYPAAVPVQFTLPSNTAPPMQLPSQYATAYNSPNLNYQTVPGPSGPHGPQQTYQPQQFMAQPRRFSQPSRSSSASQLQVPQGSRQQMHYSVQTPPPYTFTTPHQPAVTNPSVQTPQLGPIPQTPSVSPTPSLMGQVPSHHRAPSRSAPLAHHERLIPAPRLRIGIQDHPHSPYEKRSVEISLHQVHLRSPKRIPGEIPAMSERHYQSIKSFAFGPQVTPPRSTLYHISFTISDADLTKVSRDEMVRGEHLPVSRFASGSLRIRIRCCYKNPASPNTEHAWVTTDTLWPEHIYMELNGVALGIKRKAHHSKDLPAEASSLVKAGANLLRVFIPNANSKYPGLEPHIAVEVVEVLSHSAILQMVREFGTLPSSVTRNVISSRLNGASSVANDDDLAMVMDGLSIDLADPFTFQMFRVPVRGVSCTHLECFDLETWLNTRLGKKSCYHASASDCGICPKEPSFVDKWKCPLCDGDARPYSLRIDEFLVEVRAKLESDQMLRTKSILVSADGSWKPREQSASDDSDHESDDGCTLAAKTDNTTPMLATPKQRERLQVEVIELDDD